MLACDFIDLIDKDDALLRLIHIVVRCSEKLAHNAFDVVTNISRLCQGGCIRNRQRNVQKLRQRLYQIGLTTAGRSDHQDIGLFDFNLIHCACGNPLIMVVNCYGNDFFGIFLTDHILIKLLFNLMWCGNGL